MSGEAREIERDLTRAEFFGWLARMYRRHQDEQAQTTEEPACDDSTASE